MSDKTNNVLHLNTDLFVVAYEKESYKDEGTPVYTSVPQAEELLNVVKQQVYGKNAYIGVVAKEAKVKIAHYVVEGSVSYELAEGQFITGRVAERPTPFTYPKHKNLFAHWND